MQIADVPQTDHLVRLTVDHHKHRKAIILTIARVDPMPGGYEQIPLSSMQFFDVAPAARKNDKQTAACADHLRPVAVELATAYAAGKDKHEIRRIILTRIGF